jgi:hypothetical protein
MVIRYTTLFISIFLVSCASRKVAISKTEIKTHIDSVVTEKKDSISIKNNAIYITEQTNEIEILPIDSTKSIFIDGKEFKNAIIRFKKTNKNVIDTSKSVVLQSIQKVVQVKKDISTKTFEKQVDKKANYWVYFYIMIIAGLVYLIKKYFF